MDQGRVVDNIRVTSLKGKHADVDMDQKGTAVGRLRRDKDKRPVMISEVRKLPFIGRVVDADDKRPVTISEVRKSPFIGRVVDADG
nr:hypothetical protein [Tanacetum cinerariifolium]